MFNRLMQIEKNIPRIEHNSGEFTIVVTVARRGTVTITQEEAEILLTQEFPFLFTQRKRYGVSPRLMIGSLGSITVIGVRSRSVESPT